MLPQPTPPWLGFCFSNFLCALVEKLNQHLTQPTRSEQSCDQTVSMVLLQFVPSVQDESVVPTTWLTCRRCIDSFVFRGTLPFIPSFITTNSAELWRDALIEWFIPTSYEIVDLSSIHFFSLFSSFVSSTRGSRNMRIGFQVICFSLSFSLRLIVFSANIIHKRVTTVRKGDATKIPAVFVALFVFAESPSTSLSVGNRFDEKGCIFCSNCHGPWNVVEWNFWCA